MSSAVQDLPWPQLIARLLSDTERRATDLSAQDDAEAWREFVRRIESYGTAVRRWYPAIPLDEMEDWVAELVSQYSTLGELRKLEQVTAHVTFFTRALKNKAIDARRKALVRDRSQEQVVAQVYSGGEEAGGTDSDHELLIQRLRARLRDLPEKDRELIQMRINHGKSLQQIATETATPYGTIASRWFRLMRLLEREMKAEGNPQA